MAYAETTKVPIEKSKIEIERLLTKNGANKYMNFWDEDSAVIQFMLSDRMIRFKMPMPERNEKRFTHSSRGRRTAEAAYSAWEQGCRQKWRALFLVIKAKLEAIDSGIVSFDEEFMPHIVLPSGQTMAEEYVPQIAEAYSNGRQPKMLPDYT